jgi:hypothetical protein
MFSENNNSNIRGMKIVFSIAIILIFTASTHAEELTNADDNNNKNSVNNLQSSSGLYHPKAKRAWNQLQSGSWGKRSPYETDADDESIEQLQRKLMKLYAEQLLANRLSDDDMEYYNGDYDNNNNVEKRAWSQLQNSWGKRDWNQLRGKSD